MYMKLKTEIKTKKDTELARKYNAYRLDNASSQVEN
jgi:hypothetical protein